MLKTELNQPNEGTENRAQLCKHMQSLEQVQMLSWLCAEDGL